jgi:hypothetical protein
MLTACYTCHLRTFCAFEQPDQPSQKPYLCPILDFLAKQGPLQVGPPRFLKPREIFEPEYSRHKEMLVPWQN